MLGSTQEKPRIKRAFSVQQSPKLSVKHLALELAEKHVSFAKTIFDKEKNNNMSLYGLFLIAIK